MIDRLAQRLALLVLAVGILLRVVQLGADPYYYEWNGYITDEGRWIAHARALILFGDIGAGGPALHLLLAPLFQAAELVVFAAAGVSLSSARLVSVVAGSALLVVFWAAFRRFESPSALLLVLTMLAVEMDVVVLSRLAIPEMAAMVLSFGAFLLLAGARTARQILAGGVVVAAAVAAKATVLPLVLIFAALVLTHAPAAGLSRRRALAAYATGVFVPAVFAVGIFVAAGATGAIPLGALLRVVGRFVGVAPLYELVAFPFEDTVAPVLALWSLAAWLGCLGGLTVGATGEPSGGRACLRGALLWTGAFAPMMFVLDYFPARYKLHVLVPLAIVAVVGLTRLERGGLGGLTTALPRLAGLRRVSAALLLCAPSVIIVAAALLSLARTIGLQPDRMRTRYAVLMITLTAGTILTAGMLHRARLVRLLVWMPALWTMGWLAASRLTVTGAPLWPDAMASGQTLRWTLLLTTGAGALAAAAIPAWPRAAAGASLVGAAILFGVLGLGRLAPGYLDPHYSIRDSSRDLGSLLAGMPGSIRSVGGEALFSENRLRYRSIMGTRWPSPPADVLVLSGRMEDSDGRLRGYQLIRQYSIYVSPEFVLGEPSWSPAVGQFQRTNVRVYRRGG